MSRRALSPARFVADEHGAVGVDWIALSALVVGMALLALAGLSNASDHVSGNIDAALVYLHQPEGG